MGHIQDMTKEQKSNFLSDKYQKLKESRLGCSYVYWNEKLDKELTEKGYQWYGFGKNYNKDATWSEAEAKEVVSKLRKTGNYARIISGYEQCQQRIQMYSVCYKKK